MRIGSTEPVVPHDLADRPAEGRHLPHALLAAHSAGLAAGL